MSTQFLPIMSFPIIVDAEGNITPRLYCLTCRKPITDARTAGVVVGDRTLVACDRCIAEMRDSVDVLPLLDYFVGLLVNAGLGDLLRADAYEALLPMLTEENA